MVSIIDMDCMVRHLGSRWSVASSCSIEVFYSPQSLLLRPGVITRTNLLILGHARLLPCECESIRWMAALGPELSVILLSGEELLFRKL
jgi:hypothetical protein